MNDISISKAVANRVGDDIVITLPLEWIERLITLPSFERSEACNGVEIVDRVKFVNELVANLNNWNGLEELAMVEVGALIESGSDALTATIDEPKVTFG